MPPSCRNQSTDLLANHLTGFYTMETLLINRLNYLMTQLRLCKGKSKIKSLTTPCIINRSANFQKPKQCEH